MGHPGTSGADFIDYAIADNFIVNSENENFFFRKDFKSCPIVISTDDKRYFPDTNLSKEEVGLPENKFIFVLSTAHIKYNQKCLTFGWKY